MAGQQRDQARPIGQWIAGAIGLLLTLTILGYIGWQAVKAPERLPPQIIVEARTLSRSGTGYLLEFTARNRSPSTAAGVPIEGTLSSGGSTVATARTTLDYIPGQSERQGGLYFDRDPRNYDVKLQALGFSQP